MAKLTCFHCNYNTKKKFNIIRHITSRHSLEKPGKVNSKYQCRNEYKCVLCGLFSSATREEMFFHYEYIHEVTISPAVCHEFTDWDAFLTWKSAVEKQEVSEYVSYSKQNTKMGTNHYYRCHRDGFYKSRGKGRRRLKVKGSDKINGCCPASMTVKKSVDGSVRVKFVSTHVGHYQDIGRVRLPKEERDSLAQKIAQKVPMDSILEDIRTSVDISGELRRINFVRRQDLKNIVRDYNLGKGNVRHYDRVSAESRITELQQSGEVHACDSQNKQQYCDEEQLELAETVSVTEETSTMEEKKELVQSMFHRALSLCTEPQHLDFLVEMLSPVVSKLEALQPTNQFVMPKT